MALTGTFETGFTARRTASGVFGVGLISLAAIVYWFWELRKPRGLTLGTAGLTGVRGSARVDLQWEQLRTVEFRQARSGIRLILRAGSATAVIDPHYTGSDPYELAVIIEHFRDHPEHRGALVGGDPHTALELVRPRVDAR